MARIFLTALICLFCGCSIFELKDPEAPDGGDVTEDRFNIVEILRIANPSAVSMDYRDYFTDGARFIDYELTSVTGKDNVVRMLDRLRSVRTDATRIMWETAGVSLRPDDSVLNVRYTVYSGDVIIGKGAADFNFARSPDWKIAYWKDTPDGAPFFEQY
jgi:hypothetical protein